MRELRGQIVNALLVIITVAAAFCAAINFQQQRKYHLPEDGITWLDRAVAGGGTEVVAFDIEPQSPGAKAGIVPGDRLARINTVRIDTPLDVPQVLVRLGAWSKAEYFIRRNEVEVKATVIVGERVPDTALYYLYGVGVAYLAIGLFIFFRRSGAPKARHFYVLCLASFVFATFHYTGKLNTFDKIVYWGNVAAGFFAPAIFLDFCLSFPETPLWLRGRGKRLAIYLLPTVFLVALFGIASGMIRVGVPLIQLRWFLDRMWLPMLSASYLLGAAALTWYYRNAEDLILRQQLKWLRNGALLGIVPFTVFYVLPYSLGAVPTPLMKLSVLSMTLIPLTWAYAIARYRLMDVDVIFQQGYVYTLATLAVLGVIYGLIFSFGKVDELSPSAVVILIVIATFVFQPIRNYLQEVLDRYFFYRDRYDYRLTLVEFAREASSETDLNKMLWSFADRLLRTLSIQHVGFFLAADDSAGEPGRFELFLAEGVRSSELPRRPDLGFLEKNVASEDKPYLFFEHTRRNLDSRLRDHTYSVRQAIADLDYTYYIPCNVRGRTIAWLGASRTDKGDFLSSDDLELLLTMSGYVGIAVENSRLYRSLERKVDEYERLKEFSENIVESINVGILAADLDDRVESWNSQLERLTGISREKALGHPLSVLLPANLVELLSGMRTESTESGVHHLDKFRFRSGSADGAREATLNIAIAPLVSKENEQIGRLIIFDDITDRSELERRLVQADKLSSIGLLAAGVAHEVNTPLAVISTYAQMLAKQVNGDAQKASLLEKIARQTFRASEIVNSLLNFSRTSPTELVEVELSRVVADTLSLIGHQLEKARVTVALETDEDAPAFIRGNAGKLQQVFLNLFLNARDAMEGGGTLSIRIREQGGQVRLDVEDTGAGIPSEHVRRIFDPFFTTKPGKKGTGLGLSVSYGIVQEHGGSIEVESAPGQGTRFHLEFPVARRAAANQPVNV